MLLYDKWQAFVYSLLINFLLNKQILLLVRWVYHILLFLYLVGLLSGHALGFI